ncbi:hypothetical protein AAG906_003501 [Vitis piasezkii]
MIKKPTLQQGHEFIPKTNLISPLEKGKSPSKPCVQSCTQHSISSFISYKKLSSSMVAFASQLSSVEISKNVQDALKILEWKEVVLEEIKVQSLRRIRIEKW